MADWLDALETAIAARDRAVLVTVADTRGSTPRAAAARMVVTADHQFDTIGGGHLEWRAIEMARAILQSARPTPAPAALPQPQLHRFALGPALGQCCGGAVQLVFEPIDAAAHGDAIAALAGARRSGHDVWRIVALPPALSATDVAAMVPSDQADLTTGVGAGADTEIHTAIDPGRNPTVNTGFLSASEIARMRIAAAESAPGGGPMRTRLVRDEHGRLALHDLCRGQRPQVVLFGGGHVGRAIVHILGTLHCAVTWIDEREELFAAVSTLPPNVTLDITDTPEAAVREAAPGSYFLVMTHSHALDQTLTEHILLRGDAAWFGLIGSATKRAQFISRLRQRGLSGQQIDGMTCPIGIAGIGGKEPASIALAVAAQLLQLWQPNQPARRVPADRPAASVASTLPG